MDPNGTTDSAGRQHHRNRWESTESTSLPSLSQLLVTATCHVQEVLLLYLRLLGPTVPAVADPLGQMRTESLTVEGKWAPSGLPACHDVSFIPVS